VFTEIFHKFFVIVVGVAAGLGAYWYSQHHDYALWLTALIAAGGVFVLDVLFHPVLFMWRHRRRRVAVSAE
jgi:hypothetical protein